jgi:hypothetical protein
MVLLLCVVGLPTLPGLITCLGDVYTQFGYIRVGAWVDMITHILLSYQLYTST